MKDERYKDFVNCVCDLLGLENPVDILSLCQKTSDFIRPYESEIARLEAQIEKMKCRQNCMHGFEEKCRHKRCDPCSEWTLREEIKCQKHGQKK